MELLFRCQREGLAHPRPEAVRARSPKAAAAKYRIGVPEVASRGPILVTDEAGKAYRFSWELEVLPPA